MKEYVQKIEGWMEQVRDHETEVEDYDFLEEAVTEGNTLGNVGSYLAVYEKDDELYVDDELLKALDQKKTEIAKEESLSPGQIKERTNHNEAVYGDLTGKQKRKIRKGEATIQDLRESNEIEDGLIDGSFNGESSGHGFIQNMINEFKKNADYKGSSIDDSKYDKESLGQNNTASQNPNQPEVLPSGGQPTEKHRNGGELFMNEEDYEEVLNVVDAAREAELDYDEFANEIGEYDGLSDEGKFYALSEGMHAIARQDSIGAERTANLMMTYKEATDDLVDSLLGEFEDLRTCYVEDLQSNALEARNMGERMKDVSDTMGDAISNLNGVNNDISDALDDSGVSDLRRLRGMELEEEVSEE